MKQVTFHSDRAMVTIYVNGTPISVPGIVDITVKQPTQMTRGEKQGWAHISKDSAAAVTVCEVEATL
jgi:hypothetical protein